MASTSQLSYSARHYNLGQQKAGKRVSFREDDMVFVIPIERSPMLARSKLTRTLSNSRPSNLSSKTKLSQGIKGNTECSFAQSQTHRQFERSLAGFSGYTNTEQKRSSDSKDTQAEPKSILKRSSTENVLQRSRISRSLEGSSSDKRSTTCYAEDFTKGIFYPHSFSTSSTSRSSLGYTDSLKKQSGSYPPGGPAGVQHNRYNPGPQYWTSLSNSSHLKGNHFAGRTTLSKRSSVDEQSSFAEGTQARAELKPTIGSSLLRNNNNTDSLNIVGNMINISDLYPIVNDYQRVSQSLQNSKTGKIRLGAQNSNNRYILPARELISKTGSTNFRYPRETSNASLAGSNRVASFCSTHLSSAKDYASSSSPSIDARASAGLRRTAEVSLFNRLRKLEKNEPYLAWQVTERNIYSNPSSSQLPSYARNNGYQSLYSSSGLGGDRADVTGNANILFRTPSTQCYY